MYPTSGLFVTAVTASNVITLLTLVVSENTRKPLVANITKVFVILVFCKAIEISTIKFNELYFIKLLNINLVACILQKSEIYSIYSCKCIAWLWIFTDINVWLTVNNCIYTYLYSKHSWIHYKGLICDNQHKYHPITQHYKILLWVLLYCVIMISIIVVSIIMLTVIRRSVAEWQYAQCCVIFMIIVWPFMVIYSCKYIADIKYLHF